ncbi:hypothetical protein Tco_0075191, partial [Tanacetum coccineum]
MRMVRVASAVGGSHGGDVGGVMAVVTWGGRSDRSGGGESFGTWPENSPEKFFGGGWPERRWLPDFEREEGV